MNLVEGSQSVSLPTDFKPWGVCVSLKSELSRRARECRSKRNSSFGECILLWLWFDGVVVVCCAKVKMKSRANNMAADFLPRKVEEG